VPGRPSARQGRVDGVLTPHRRRGRPQSAQGRVQRAADQRVASHRSGTQRCPSGLEPVWALVQVWSDWADIPFRDVDRRPWAGLVERARKPGASMGSAPLGEPINSFDDPFALQVHPVITPQSGTSGRRVEELPLLPPYVRRGHDDQLAKITLASRGRTRVYCGPSAPANARPRRAGVSAGEGLGDGDPAQSCGGDATRAQDPEVRACGGHCRDQGRRPTAGSAARCVAGTGPAP
jgi:hypothetical protein